MIIYRCDRCGMEVDRFSKNNYINVVCYDVDFRLNTNDQYESHLDLCPRCTNELDRFLGGTPLATGFPDETDRTYSEKIRIRIGKGEM